MRRFIDSLKELKNLHSVTMLAMFGAISLILGYFTVDLGPYIKINFSSIPNEFVYQMFGPITGAFYGCVFDILNFMIRPTGPYFPGFTLNAALSGLIYGTILYKRPIRLKRILTAQLLVCIICDIFLSALWLSILYGNAFCALLPFRIFKSLIVTPVNVIIYYTLAKKLKFSY